MKLLPFLLYVVALGLFGLAGWTVYEMLPMWKPKEREEATRRGQDAATALLTTGRSHGQRSTAWVYSRDTAQWWAGFKAANLIGKPPPPKPDGPPPPPPPPPPVDVRPLEEIIELVGLVYDGQAEGKGGNTHVIVRFKPEANVEPPEWWVKENPAPGAAPVRGDIVRPPPRGQPPARANNVARPGAATPMPVSTAGREVVQRLWVDDGGDPRRSSTLWPVKAADGREMGTMRLVRVSSDAQVAYFARELPSATPGAPPEVKEEDLIKTNANLSQDLLRELRRLQGRPDDDGSARTAAAQTPATSTWMDVEETTRTGSVVNVGRSDERVFREDPDSFLSQLNFDTYMSQRSNTRGLILRGGDSKLAARFGVAAGEVLLEINGKKVESKAQAFANAKADYQRGVRTFHSKWLSNGQIVERTYQVPNK